MYEFTLEDLDEMEKYIAALHNNQPMSDETMEDVKNCIENERSYIEENN